MMTKGAKKRAEKFLGDINSASEQDKLKLTIALMNEAHKEGMKDMRWKDSR